MKYPEVLGKFIALMPIGMRSETWFSRLSSGVKLTFWRTLEKFGKQVAGEYLRDNHGTVAEALPVKKAQRTKKGKNPVWDYLDVAGTVEGELWPNGVRLVFGGNHVYLPYRKSAPSWRYVGVVTCSGRRIVRVAARRENASANIRTAAKKLLDQGVEVSAIKVELYRLKLVQVEMVGNLRKVS